MKLKGVVYGILLPILGALVSSQGMAADKNGAYRVQTVERVQTCRGLNNALAMANTENDWGRLYGYSLYAMGYVTATNRLADNTYDIAGRKNSKNLMRWLQTYCAAHPDEAFAQALHQLTLELYPARSPHAPH